MRPFWAAVSALALAIIPSQAMAARVSPMIAELEPIGRGAVTRIEIVNDSQRSIPYEIKMLRAEISRDGVLSVTPADEDFLVFPPQILLEPNARQVFRVQYIGDLELSESVIYYMSIQQLPVDIDEAATTQVQVVVNYNVLINVVPDGAIAEPVIRSITPATRSEPVPPSDAEAEAEASGESTDVPSDEPATRDVEGLEVLVGNTGNRFYLAGFATWTMRGQTLDGEDFERIYPPEQIAQIIGAGVVGPGRERLFFLPFEAAIDPASVTIDIEL